MEFWGVEVPSGKPLTCDPGEDSYVHVSQAALGENNKTGKGTERVVLKVKVGNKEIVIGTLSQGNCDQTTLDLIFEKEFVLSHNSSGSVYFCGYKTDAVREENTEFDDEEDDESAESDEDSHEDIPIPVQLASKENGKPGMKAAKSEVPARAKQPAHKVEVPVVEVKPQVSKAKLALKEEKGKVGDKNDGDDDDDDDEEEDDDEDEDDDMMESGSDDDDLDSVEDDDSDEDDESEEEQPKSGKKRPLPEVKNVGPGKKSKITATPGKTDPKTPSTPATTPKKEQQSGKKGIFPMFQSEKASPLASGKKLGQFFCQPCNKNFASEIALNQHKGAKHK